MQNTRFPGEVMEGAALPARAASERRARRPYAAPCIVRRQTVVASTLVSGDQCVFDPPLPGGGCP